MSFLKDNSIDAIITDHAYDLKKSLKGGNRDFAAYECFQYTQEDFDEKYRVLKKGCFLVEFMPEENGENYEYLYQMKKWRKKQDLNIMQKSPGKKEISLPIREENLKIRKRLHFFTKGKARNYAQMRKRIRRSQEYPTICQAPGECFQRSLTLNRQGKTPVFIRQKNQCNFCSRSLDL